MKKGFTLVELLCVIVIIAVISLITFPRVTSYINQTKESLYKTQIKDLEKSGEKWAIDNIDSLDKYHINDTFITLDVLKDFEYLEKDEILNPRTKETMDGCILISYKNNRYTYEYLDLNCASELVDLDSYSDSYVVYNSEEDFDGNFTMNEVRSNKHNPFYQEILANNELRVLGETVDGLYDLDDEYVFRGNTVNNYVKYEGQNWRILSINKKDYSMKLISTTTDRSILSTIDTTSFNKTTLQISLAESVSNYSKIMESWNNGTINSIGTISEIKSSISQNPTTLKAGLISLYDYSIASLDLNCYNDVSSGSCANNNFIATMFNGRDFWTMTQNDESEFWYISSSNTISATEATAGPYYYATVINIPINVYSSVANKTGSATNFAYELK